MNENKKELSKSNNNSNIIPYNKDFVETCNLFKSLWAATYEAISSEETPKAKVKPRPDGYDYVEGRYMDALGTKLFPGWEWLPVGDNPCQFDNPFWVKVSGKLRIIDQYKAEYLQLIKASNINPYREYMGLGAARIQYRRCDCKRINNGTPKSNCQHCNGTGSLIGWHNVIDLDKNIRSANTNARKESWNRLVGIADDVYRRSEKLILGIDELKEGVLLIENSPFPDESKQYYREVLFGLNGKQFESFKSKFLEKQQEYLNSKQNKGE